MRSAFILLLGAAVSLPLGAQAPDRVATVTGMAISRGDLAAGTDAISAEARLLELLWPRIASDYVAGHGLAASPAEIEEALAYHRAFERSDRAQRARKLEELRERLAETELAPEERARLEDFQATLRRLAQADQDRSGTSALSTPQRRALMGSWVEMWKLNRALYERYGGVVGLSGWGPWPHGARAALVADYERLGLLEIADAGLREHLYALLRRPPPRPVPPDRVDFTPYWTRPIPPSYFPD
ncbi:MAG TPA: hypothetical protein VLC73_06880 [Burkholderiales bacterium]|nr:hypothetical protein [Burkholderiales bacterium]